MKILVLDNYDSFTYNLVHILRELVDDSSLEIYRNDKISIDAVDKYDKIVLSPGPGIPEEAGIMPELIKKYASSKSILGVCLGHQAIAEAFGAELFNLDQVLHGIEGDVFVEDKTCRLFKDLPTKFKGCHYHSWAVRKDTIKSPLKITAMGNHDLVMGLKHEEYDIHGLQFHPESILTEFGKEMVNNWLNSSK